MALCVTNAIGDTGFHTVWGLSSRERGAPPSAGQGRPRADGCGSVHRGEPAKGRPAAPRCAPVSLPHAKRTRFLRERPRALSKQAAAGGEAGCYGHWRGCRGGRWPPCPPLHSKAARQKVLPLTHTPTPSPRRGGRAVFAAAETHCPLRATTRAGFPEHLLALRTPVENHAPGENDPKTLVSFLQSHPSQRAELSPVFATRPKRIQTLSQWNPPSDCSQA